MSFANLKKNRKNSLSAMTNLIEKSEKGGNFKDEREWKYTYDTKTKIGSVTIRFLPYGDGNRLPYAHWFYFSFGDWKSKQFYFERSRATIGEKDPAAEFRAIYKDVNEEKARSFSRKQQYLANILVIDDPKNPENNGKVFIYKFGAAIAKKITAKLIPEYDDQEASDVFDFWEGENFKIRSKEKGGFLNYDDSEFMGKSEISETDEKLEEIYNSMHKLEEFEDEKNYKSYGDLKTKLIDTMNKTHPGLVKKVMSESWIGDKGESEVKDEQPVEPKVERKLPPKRTVPKKVEPVVEEDNDPFGDLGLDDEPEQPEVKKEEKKEVDIFDSKDVTNDEDFDDMFENL